MNTGVPLTFHPMNGGTSPDIGDQDKDEWVVVCDSMVGSVRPTVCFYP